MEYKAASHVHEGESLVSPHERPLHESEQLWCFCLHIYIFGALFKKGNFNQGKVSAQVQSLNVECFSCMNLRQMRHYCTKFMQTNDNTDLSSAQSCYLTMYRHFYFKMHYLGWCLSLRQALVIRRILTCWGKSLKEEGRMAKIVTKILQFHFLQDLFNDSE